MLSSEGVIAKHLVRVWNVTLVNKKKIKVATIEQGPKKKSMCEGCSAPCCQGMFLPILIKDEFLNRKFPIAYTVPEPWFQQQVPTAQFLATLALTGKGCPYFDSKTHKCKVFPNCPKACLAYDCREDVRPKIAKFAKLRERRLKRGRNGNY
jgi:Fe-S-cluster containining protein